MAFTRVLGDLLKRRAAEVEDWFADKFSCYPAALNVSVDLRSSEYKIAPVDVNLFPAGYNNFSFDARVRSVALLRKYLSQYIGCKVLVVIEGHTRNKKYLDSVAVFRDIIGEAGFDVEIGECQIAEDTEVVSFTGQVLSVKALTNRGGIVSTVSGFVPDLILLNNDMTSGVPEVLRVVAKHQSVMPPPCLGWFNRRKSSCLSVYESIASEFCTKFQLDAWLICALFAHCEDVNFIEKRGMDRIADTVELVVSGMREKFQLYGVQEVPYVFVKADNGTYGMGVVEVYGGEDVLRMNKKNRSKMSRIKHNNLVSSVVIQEGIPTSELFRDCVAEPLLYYIGEELACYLCRYSATRDRFVSLNSPGCGFADVEREVPEDKRRVWWLVSKLAALAAAVEVSQVLDAT